MIRIKVVLRPGWLISTTTLNTRDEFDVIGGKRHREGNVSVNDRIIHDSGIHKCSRNPLELQSQWPDDLEESVQHHLRISGWTHCTIDITIIRMTTCAEYRGFDAEWYRER